MMGSPERTSAVIPTTPETAGMPRLRARMAAWLVPPPVSVTIPAMARFPRLMAWLLGHRREDRLQLGGRGRHRDVEPLDLGRDKLRVGQGLRLGGAEDRVDPMGDAHDHTRADRDSFMHKGHSLARTGRSTQTG